VLTLEHLKKDSSSPLRISVEKLNMMLFAGAGAITAVTILLAVLL
jgi:hypothetical protein